MNVTSPFYCVIASANEDYNDDDGGGKKEVHIQRSYVEHKIERLKRNIGAENAKSVNTYSVRSHQTPHTHTRAGPESIDERRKNFSEKKVGKFCLTNKSIENIGNDRE